MSTLDRPEPRTFPPLVNGQRLDRASFHERYEAMPPDTRAELVGGVVFMPSPLRVNHGERDKDLAYWIAHYQRFTKGVRAATNATTQFDDYGEPQPDLQLRIPAERGGQTRIVSGYVVGPPELIVEVSGSSRWYDLGPKKDDYERAGVVEYLFVGLDPQEILWFIRRGGRFVAMTPGPDGLYRSEVFPGLWLDPRALFAEDLDGIAATVEQGIAAPEHAAFVARLADAAG